jgi:hypothetical protein
MLDIMQDPDFIADLQRQADADHARQSVCSWCGRPGEPYEYKGVRFDGLVACQGDRLCKRCADAYLESTPLLVEEVTWTGMVRSSRVYDPNPRTWDWSEENIPGCHGQPPVRAIAVDRHPEYADYVRPGRRRGARGE